MQKSRTGSLEILSALIFATVALGGCGMPAGNANLTAANTTVSNLNSNIANTNAASGSVVMAREPEQYQGMIRLTLETVGETQKATLPTIGAKVARSGADRAMEFTLPTNEKVIYLDKGNMHYVILPNRKQYAELTEEALGFEVRKMMTPAQIVDQAKAIPGVTLVGDETVNGRTVSKYTYRGTAATQTQAGTVETESYMLIDKETGLPMRTETVSQSQSGGNVQGYKGLRLVTEMTDITTTPEAAMFNVPTEFQKIDPEQVKAQAALIFNAVGALIGQAMNQAQTTTTASPTASPARY